MNAWKYLFIVAAFVTWPSIALAQPPAMHMGADWRKMSVWDCNNKTAQAFQDKEHVLRMERSGNQTWAYTAKTIALVSCVPLGNSLYILVAAASRDSVEAERMRNEVRTHVFDAPAPTSRYPDHYDANSSALGGGGYSPPLAMHWGSDSRPKSVYQCVASARYAMSQLNLHESVSGRVVWGTTNDVTAFVDCAPGGRGAHMHVVVASADSGLAEHYRNEIRRVTFDSVLIDR